MKTITDIKYLLKSYNYPTDVLSSLTTLDPSTIDAIRSGTQKATSDQAIARDSAVHWLNTIKKHGYILVIDPNK